MAHAGRIDLTEERAKRVEEIARTGIGWQFEETD
jgi:hypothetical protein